MNQPSNVTVNAVGPIMLIPTKEIINNLKVGDAALSCFGEWEEVSDIFGRGLDIEGGSWVCFYTRSHNGLTVSHSYHESQLIRTVPLSGLHTSAELDKIEHQMLSQIL